ncbi:Tubulin-folding cofactor E [Chlorella vulgaris]
MAHDTQEPAVGRRLLLGGKHAATVRYVGPLEGQHGTWVGIEYDEAGRGKHDGSLGSTRYFCSTNPTAGSFVRLPKLLEAGDFGRSLAEAALDRYGRMSVGGNGQPAAVASYGDLGAETEQLYVSTSSNRRIPVDLRVPSASTRRLSGAAGAALAVLACQRIATVGTASELQALLPTLTDLDLSDNLIANWSFVVELAAALPSLTTLNLSGNRLALPSPPHAAVPSPTTALASLQSLVLNGCGVSWPQTVAVAQLLPNLRQLRLCSNGLSSLQLPHGQALEAAAAGAGKLSLNNENNSGGSDGGSSDGSHTSELLAAAFANLELLDLEDNAIACWAEVALLSRLPRLHSLLLSGNRLRTVQYTSGFDSLTALMLGSNQLGSWEAACQLDRFPSLRDARLSDNPITAAAPSTARYQCIARISQLTSLNASVVSAAERWDAELNYLRQKYGELAPTAPQAAAGSALASSMVQLTICHGAKRLEKKLPASLTVGKLKLMLERLLRVKAGQQALLLVPPEGSSSQPEDISDEEGRELRYYDVGDGWRLDVTVGDSAARAATLAAAKDAAAMAHAERMEQHEKAIQQFRAVEQRLMV